MPPLGARGDVRCRCARAGRRSHACRRSRTVRRCELRPASTRAWRRRRLGTGRRRSTCRAGVALFLCLLARTVSARGRAPRRVRRPVRRRPLRVVREQGLRRRRGRALGSRGGPCPCPHLPPAGASVFHRAPCWRGSRRLRRAAPSGPPRGAPSAPAARPTLDPSAGTPCRPMARSRACAVRTRVAPGRCAPLVPEEAGATEPWRASTWRSSPSSTSGSFTARTKVIRPANAAATCAGQTARAAGEARRVQAQRAGGREQDASSRAGQRDGQQRVAPCAREV